MLMLEIIPHDDVRKYYVRGPRGEECYRIFYPKSQYVTGDFVEKKEEELEAVKFGLWRERRVKGGKRS